MHEPTVKETNWNDVLLFKCFHIFFLCRSRGDVETVSFPLNVLYKDSMWTEGIMFVRSKGAVWNPQVSSTVTHEDLHRSPSTPVWFSRHESEVIVSSVKPNQTVKLFHIRSFMFVIYRFHRRTGVKIGSKQKFRKSIRINNVLIIELR